MIFRLICLAAGVLLFLFALGMGVYVALASA
jgi:hypothetical protein